MRSYIPSRKDPFLGGKLSSNSFFIHDRLSLYPNTLEGGAINSGPTGRGIVSATI